MANDQQTFKRAAGAALIGLATQLVLAVVMALIGLYAQSPAIHAAAWHFFGGLPIWIILWVLFHQQQLERIEALESQELSRTDARAAALFDEAGQQLAIARNRLESIHRWWLPIVSIAVAAYLVITGGSLLFLNYRAQQSGTLLSGALNEAAANNLGVVFTVLLVIGFIAFLVARYVAGMTRLKEWTLLRGGASYLMGGVVIAALLVVGIASVWFGNPSVFAAMALVIPALMVLLGGEILLGFVFGLYRPRRPGEISRPAFDARSLGWLTRPESLGKIINEAVNYQFGFEISASWFYRLLSKAIVPLILIALAVLIGMTSIVIVAPQQQAVITHFGAFKRVVEKPGLTWKWPWPIDVVQKYDVYRVHEVAVGSEPGALRPGVPILWTNQHAESAEDYMVTAPAQMGDPDEVLADQAVAGELVGARIVVKYRVADLEAFIKSAQDPARMLETLATRRVNTYFVTHDIDTLLAGGRIAGAQQLREQIQQDISSLNPPLGIEVVFVGFEAVHPPQEGDVAAAFHDQIDARQEKASAIEDAKKQAITVLAEVAGSQDMALQIDAAVGELDRIRQRIARATDPEAVATLREQEAVQEVEIERLMDQAGGKAAQMIYEARAYRWSHALAERARAMAVRSQHASYQRAPEYFQKRMYLQTVAEALDNRRKYVIAGDPEGTKDIRLELQQEGAALSGLFSDE